ncbi:uncharacterized protein KQ657_001363 [Scheffersomyces spartinae]|uniref:Uncharacterized protein n=1 Tax=Scheffersomyces spartinae TaxID=45513 RepID=A0A9P7V8Q7_9ASCO|nr:uncharacterized protein KQ657_001363 [Scheffersomyces spartinae]KAG7192906.1 hypothetical protein KQ657_001363 [Scheffersomyces spartinae]
MKCDEQQPVCANCLRSKRKCYRGIRLNFTQYTIYNPKKSLSSSSSGPNEFGAYVSEYHHRQFYDRELLSRSHKILDQSITIASLYKDGYKKYEPYVRLHSKKDLELSKLHFQRDMNAYNAKLPPLTGSSSSTSSTTNSSYPNTTLSRSLSYLPTTRHRSQGYINASFHPVSEYELMPPPQTIPTHIDSTRNEYHSYQLTSQDTHGQNYGLMQTYIAPMRHPAPQQDQSTFPYRNSDATQYLQQLHSYRDPQHQQPYYKHMEYREGCPPSQRPQQGPVPQPSNIPYQISRASLGATPAPAPPPPPPPPSGPGPGPSQHIPYYQPALDGHHSNYDNYFSSNAQVSNTPSHSNTIGLRPISIRHNTNSNNQLMHTAIPPQQHYYSSDRIARMAPQYSPLGYHNPEDIPQGPSETPQVQQFPASFHPQSLTPPQHLSLITNSGNADIRTSLQAPGSSSFMPPTSTMPPDLLAQNPLNVDTMTIPQPNFGGDVTNRQSYQQAPDFSFSSGLVGTSSGGETSTRSGAPGSWIKPDPTYPGWQEDFEKYLQVLEDEKYYWLLDMFNEKGVWKSIIPPYCLQERAENNNGFLLECLLNCSRSSGNPRLESIIEVQLSIFDKIFDSVDPNTKQPILNKNLKGKSLDILVLQLLISISLILLMFQIKLTNYLMQIGTYSVTVINNQLKLFAILCELIFLNNKFSFTTTTANTTIDDTKKTTEIGVMKVCAMYSVTILKFFLLKYLQANRKLMDFNNIDDKGPSKWKIVYDYASNNLYYLFNLNLFEIENLKTFYHGFSHCQTFINQKEGNNSDASNLREIIWKVIRYHYEVLNPEKFIDKTTSSNIKVEMHNKSDTNNALLAETEKIYSTKNHDAAPVLPLLNEKLGIKSGSVNDLFNPHRLNRYDYTGKDGTALLPNDRILSMGLLTNYMNSIVANQVDEPTSSTFYKKKIVGVFQALSDSFLESDLALRWERNYSWLLQT